MTVSNLIEKILKKFGSKYRSIRDEQFAFFLAQAMYSVISARIGKQNLVTAIADDR
jgi:hypothetical protein